MNKTTATALMFAVESGDIKSLDAIARSEACRAYKLQDLLHKVLKATGPVIIDGFAYFADEQGVSVTRESAS